MTAPGSVVCWTSFTKKCDLDGGLFPESLTFCAQNDHRHYNRHVNECQVNNTTQCTSSLRNFASTYLVINHFLYDDIGRGRWVQKRCVAVRAHWSCSAACRLRNWGRGSRHVVRCRSLGDLRRWYHLLLLHPPLHDLPVESLLLFSPLHPLPHQSFHLRSATYDNTILVVDCWLRCLRWVTVFTCVGAGAGVIAVCG